MINLVAVFLYPYPAEKKHFNVVVGEVSEDTVILAFISSIVKNKGYDKSCVLTEKDAGFIIHPSYIVYDKLWFFHRPKLEAMIASGEIQIREHLSESVVQRIREGALQSKMIRIQYRKYFRD